MKTYKASGIVIVYATDPHTNKEDEQTLRLETDIEAASEAEAFEAAENKLCTLAWFQADYPADHIEDIAILDTKLTPITERDRLASLPRSVAPTLPGFEAAI